MVSGVLGDLATCSNGLVGWVLGRSLHAKH